MPPELTASCPDLMFMTTMMCLVSYILLKRKATPACGTLGELSAVYVSSNAPDC